MARPLKVINEQQVFDLASFFCTDEQIATIVGCSPDTLSRRFAEIIQKGRESAKHNIRRKQYEVAMSGNVSMLIWLGKQYLGQSDKQEIAASVQAIKINKDEENL